MARSVWECRGVTPRIHITGNRVKVCNQLYIPVTLVPGKKPTVPVA